MMAEQSRLHEEVTLPTGGVRTFDQRIDRQNELLIAEDAKPGPEPGSGSSSSGGSSQSSSTSSPTTHLPKHSYSHLHAMRQPASSQSPVQTSATAVSSTLGPATPSSTASKATPVNTVSNSTPSSTASKATPSSTASNSTPVNTVSNSATASSNSPASNSPARNSLAANSPASNSLTSNSFAPNSTPVSTSTSTAVSTAPVTTSTPGSTDGAVSGSAVKETRHISIDYNPVSGRKTLNTYEIIHELGRGEHGRVKLGYDVNKMIYVAIKLINRKEKPRLGRPQGSSKLEKIHREIAILKKCSHPNIVRLLEVLDDEKSRKIYLVLEYCRKGEIRWQLPDGRPALNREQARSVARDVVLGLEYLHINNVIHRDIKPANLLVADDNVVKISDFGVSYIISSETSPGAELELAKTVGTPAFFSPELCIPTETRENGERKLPCISSKVDVWAFGVTLFCFLYGYLPFEADNEYELFRVIANDEVTFPDTKDDADLAQANDLLAKLLIKDPIERPSIAQIKDHPWLLKNISRSTKEEFLHHINKDAIEVSPEEVDQAVKGVSFKSRIKQSLSRFAGTMKPHSRSRLKVQDDAGVPTTSSPGSKGSATAPAVPANKLSSLAISSNPKPSSSSSSTSHRNDHNNAKSTPKSMNTPPASSSSSSLQHVADSSHGPTPPLPASSSISHSVISRDSLSSLSDGIVESDSQVSLQHIPYHGNADAASSRGHHGGPNHSANHGQHHARHRPSSSGGTMGLMPMNIADDTSSLTSNKTPKLTESTSRLKENTKHPSFDPMEYDHGVDHHVEPLPTHLNTRLPKIEIPRLDSDSFWDDPDTSSSSSEDDSGELTLVVGRNRSRSIERGHSTSGGPSSGSSSNRTSPPPQLPAIPSSVSPTASPTMPKPPHHHESQQSSDLP